ncbi:MAG: hypothetical protein DSY42_05110 [Aquifex sp.]|nr:MAG: hypothetical protein DSY42_05110 [Aquifex sp.]
MAKTALHLYLEKEFGFEFDNPKELKQKLKELWEKDPQKFGDVVTKLKELGDRISTEAGFTISLDDLEPVHELKPKTDDINKALKLQSEIPNKLVDMLHEKGNAFAKMIKSKARGKPAQLMQMVVSPILFADAKNKPFPFVIKNSFAEGLRPEEYFASSVGARKGIIATQLATSEPGALSKELIANVAHLVVTEKDCGTTRGMKYPIDSEHILDRYLAHNHGKFPRNTLVTPRVRDEMKKTGIKEVEVRTPLTCMAKDGVCAYCLGPVGDRKLPEVGFNIGVVAGQTVTEPLTQFVLSFKHTGGLASALRTTGFDLVKQLLHMPKNFSNKATLATVSGKVEKVEKAPLGGWFVYINGKEHYVQSDSEPTVKPGDKVSKGDPISKGFINPKELLELKGIKETREYLAQALHSVYKSQGTDIHPKIFESLARALVKYVEVEDPGTTGLTKGEIVDFDGLRRHIEDKVKIVPKEKAVGKILAREYGDLPPGTEIKKEHLKLLPKKVEVTEHKFKVKPYLPPLQKAHLFNSDWLVGVSRSELLKVLTEGAWYGKTSKLRWYHPLPGYVYGEGFGEGEDGRY